MKHRIRRIIVACGIILTIIVTSIIYHAALSTNENIRRQTVLIYYRTIGRNAEKYKSALFLLDNMKYHHSCGLMHKDNTEVRHWIENAIITLEDLLEEYGIYNIPADTIRYIREKRRSDSLVFTKLDKDIDVTFSPFIDGEKITAAFLIQHINHAHKIWKSSKFAHVLTFDEFKEYILPYKAFNGYGFLESGNTYASMFSKLINTDSIHSPIDCITPYNYIMRVLRDLSGSRDCSSGRKGLYDLFFYRTHTCDDLAAYSCYILRSLGIPITIEHTIGYRSFLGMHYFCSIYDPYAKNWATFNPEAYDPTISWEKEENLNIYRNTYGAQPNTPYFLRADGEFIPEELSNPCMTDVTSHVEQVYQVTLPISVKENCNLAYLATFNRKATEALLHTTWGIINKTDSIVTFKNVLPHVLYFPVYYQDGMLEVFSTPFYLDSDGNISFLPHVSLNDNSTTNITVTRKYPRKPNMIKAAEELVGGVFTGTNDWSLKQADTLYKIASAPNPIFTEYKFKRPKAYQIYRFEASPTSKKTHIAMLEWVTSKKYGYENTLPASRIHMLSPKDVRKDKTVMLKVLDEPIEKMQRKAEYDGSMLTAPSYYSSITFWLKEPQVITAVRFAPLNADNGITAGHTYELLYWDNGWNSVATATADYEYLCFNNVPKNKLYWLRNATKGKEEQLFVVNKKGEQLFIYSDIIDRLDNYVQ